MHDLVKDTLTTSRGCSKADKILILLMKCRQNQSYVAMAPMFGIHKTSVSQFFKEALMVVFNLASKHLYWFSKEEVQGDEKSIILFEFLVNL